MKETGLALVHKGEIIIPVKKEIIDVIKNHKLIKYKGKVINAYLVGSHAKGTPRDDSDIDIVLQIPVQKDYSEEDFTKLKRKALQDYFMKNNIVGKADHIHPNYKGKRVDVYFTYKELKEGESVKLLK